jgi:bis(5'-nucleosyl)-tetraphosphatase (symmetrical)
MVEQRRVFIGDVQGCRVELERLLEALRFDPARDRLLPVGDLVNRGPDSLGCLRLLESLGAEPVLGNHDLHLLATASGARARGPRDTVADVLGAPPREELLAGLATRPFVRVFEDLYLVHAALHPRWRDPARVLAGADPRAPSAEALFAVRTRSCDGRGNVPLSEAQEERPPFAPWFDWYDPARHGGRRVVFGHWSMLGLVRAPHVIGLDTGCVWGRELSAWIAEENRLVQVRAERAYAPYD